MNENKTDWLAFAVSIVMLALFACMAYSEYLTYLSTKMKFEVIQTAISNNMTLEQIKEVLSFKNK